MLPPPMNVMVMVRRFPGREGCAGRDRGVSRRGRADARAPNIAVPRRTSVAPSAIAASRSADMPIDSVSTASPAARHAAAHSRQHVELRALPRPSSVASAMPMKPRRRSRGSVGDQLRQRERVARRDTALGGLAADVHLHADVERRQRRRPRRGQAPRDLLPVDRVHPGEARRHRRRLVALQRPDQVPLDVTEVRERVHLGQRLLHVVLAERALAERVQRAHRLPPERSCSPRAGGSRRGRARRSAPRAAMRALASCHAFS